MRQYLISSVFSLSLISLAQAAELTIEQQCQALGYNTKISDCERAGSVALVCPLNDQATDMAVCITDSCRGYPLYQKNGKFYYQDQSGNEVEAVPSKGQITDYVEGNLEKCNTRNSDNAITYYRVPKCKGEALYNNYFCDVGCDTEKKYPYTYHPGSTAGTVQKCVTADQTYYGYSSCNKGWLGGWASASGIGKCGLDDCDMIDYPYPDEPNANYYGENRGKTETCKIGGATYYRYTECNGSDFVLKGVNTRDKKGTVCARKCPVTDCTNTPFTHTYPNGDTANINDWSCKIDSKCVAGDIATYNGKDVGVILASEYKFPDETERMLIIPTNYSEVKKVWSIGNASIQDIPQLENQDITTWGKTQTVGILMYGEQQGYNYPAAEYCFTYTPYSNETFYGSHEWYLPSSDELFLLLDVKYIIANSVPDRYLANCGFAGSYGSSSEHSAQSVRVLHLGKPDGSAKASERIIIPYLSFKKK